MIPLLPFIVWIETAVLLLFPGRHGTVLDGIPLNGPLEYTLTILLFLNFFLYALHRASVPIPWNRLVHLWPNSLAGLRKKHAKIFFIALLVKTGLFVSNFACPPDDFAVSYYPSEAPQAAPYINFDNLFRFKHASYLTDRFIWDAAGRYERWSRNDHGYSSEVHVALSGFIQNPPDHELNVQASGSAHVRIAGIEITSTPGHPIDRIIQIPSRDPILSVDAEGEANENLRMEVRVRNRGRWKTSSPIAPSPRRRLMSTALALLAWVPAGVLLARGLLFSLQLFSVMTTPFPFILLLLFCLFLDYFPSHSFLLMMSLLYTCVIAGKHLRRPIPLFHTVVILVLAALFYFVSNYSFRTVEIRLPTDDPVTYETYGRAVVKELSLKGGESVFTYQPGFRYYMTALLLIFGEYNVFPKFLNLCFFLTIFWILWAGVDERAGWTWGSRAALLIGLAFIGRTPLGNVYFNLTEFLSWILIGVAVLIAGVPLRLTTSGLDYDSRSLPEGAAYTGVFCLAFAGITRPNMVFGVSSLALGWAFLYARARSKPDHPRRVLQISFAIFLAIVLLPLWHNWHYGHRWLLFSNDATNRSTLVLPPRDLLHLTSQQEIRDTLKYQLSNMIAIGPFARRYLDGTSRLLAHLILLLFVTGSIRWTRLHRGRYVLATWIILLAFAGVHVFYQVNNYYPRHIVIFYLWMGLVSPFFLGRPKPGTPS